MPLIRFFYFWWLFQLAKKFYKSQQNYTDCIKKAMPPSLRATMKIAPTWTVIFRRGGQPQGIAPTEVVARGVGGID